MALDENSETFVIYVASLKLVPGIHPDKETQIAFLLTKEVKIPGKYLDFADIFSEKKILRLPERIKFNEHIIDLEYNKQPLYGPIYSLGPIELETLKTYIEIYLKTRFIWLSRSLVGAFILFDKMPNGSFYLWIDYWGLNNLTIKNRHPLPLIKESVDRLSQANSFI